MPVTVTGRLICADAAEAELVRALLPEHVRLTRAEPGCELFEVEELPGTTIWTVTERFADRAAFEAHQSRRRTATGAASTRPIRREIDVAEAP